MPILHNLQNIPLELYLSIKVLIMKFLHWQLRPSCFILPKIRVLQVDISTDGFTGEGDFFVDPSAIFRYAGPVTDGCGEESQEEEEEVECP
jgi:hypothetical protein